MSSFIKRSDPRLSGRVAMMATVALLFATTHVAFEQAARFAERHLDAFLWKQQDTLRLFSAHNYVDRGRGRLLICGPSEAREALLPEEIAAGIPDFEPYQNSQSIGTLDDALVILEYIERAYGSTAIPDAILFGITSRFVANIRSEPSPLFRTINQYSPHFRVVEGTEPPQLVPRTTLESLQARAALLALQPDRYRRGLFAIASRMATMLMPSLAGRRWTWEPIVAAKYIEGRLFNDEAIKDWLVEPGGFWANIHAWDPASAGKESARHLRLLHDYSSRHGIQLYVVNLPEISWNRELYDPMRYESYLQMVRSKLPTAAFLDLRTLVADEDFYDSSHTTWAASKEVSRQVATFIREHRANELDARIHGERD